MQNNICHHIVDNNFAIYKKFVLVELWQIEKTTIIHNYQENIKETTIKSNPSYIVTSMRLCY